MTFSKDKELDVLTYDLGTNKNNSQIRFNTLAILGPSAEYLSRLPLNDRKAIFKWLVTIDDST